MPNPAYLKRNLSIRRGHRNTGEVKALQTALRALGYLPRGIDGDFGFHETWLPNVNWLQLVT